MVSGLPRSRPLHSGPGSLLAPKYISCFVILFLTLVCRVELTIGRTFTLASDDGSYYPQLDNLLQNPNSSFIVSNVKELQALPLFNAATQSLPVTGKIVFVSVSFFSVFGSAPVLLWEEAQNGTRLVPIFFDVQEGAELLLVDFHLNWAAQRDGHSFTTAGGQPSTIQTLLERLKLYVKLHSTGKLQLLRTTVEGMGCDGLRQLYAVFNVSRTQPDAVSGDVTASLRYVYPYLFIKYAQIGPIWMEDVTLSCAAFAGLSPEACPRTDPTVFNITSHDDFMAALDTVDQTDVPVCVTHTTVFRLLNDVSLDVSRWPRGGGGVYITSNVSIECSPDQVVVLDLGGGLDLFKIRGAAFVRLVNVVIANLPLAPVSLYVVPVWSFNFARELTPAPEGRLHLLNVTSVVPRDEFVYLQYWTAILSFQGQPVSSLGSWQRLVQVPVQVANASNDSLVLVALNGMGITCQNISLTIRTFGVNLLLPETGVIQLMGTEVRTGPPYIIAVYSPPQLARVLSMPDERLTTMAELDGLTDGSSTSVVLLLQSNMTLGGALWPDGLRLPVRRQVIIQGRPFKDVHLDFRGGRGLLEASGDGNVHFKYLTLRNAGWPANYTAETAAQERSPLNFMQLGLWPVEFDRTAAARVHLSHVDLLMSEDEARILMACHASYGANGSTAMPLHGGLTTQMCLQLLPRNAGVNISTSGPPAISVANMQLGPLVAASLTLKADLQVDRPDLHYLLERGYSGDSDNVAAIVGGAVGGAVACTLLAVAVLVFITRRSRSRAQERQLRELQAKQALQLEELSKTNPLAQLILDHIAGKDSGGNSLIIGGGGAAATAAATSSGCGTTDTASSGSNGAVGLAGTASGENVVATGGGGNGDPGSGSAAITHRSTECITLEDSCSKSRQETFTLTSTLPGGAAPAGSLAAVTGTGAGTGTSTPVNITATDLAELFKHLTILGFSNMAADRNSPDSRGFRARYSLTGAPPAGVGHKGKAGGAGAGAAGGAQGLSALALALAHRLHFRERTEGAGAPAGTGTGAGTAGGVDERESGPTPRLSEEKSTGTGSPRDTGLGCVAGAGMTRAAAVGGSTGKSGEVGTRGTAAEASPTAAVAGANAPAGCGERVREGEGRDGGGGGGGGDGAAGSKAVQGARAEAEISDATTGATAVTGAMPSLPQGIQEQLAHSPVLEELLRLSMDLAGEIDDNQLIVTDVVACGGFGTVYKGLWHNLPVAVKIVLFSTASVNRRIALQEAALSKSISHPNIIATYAVDAKPMVVLGRAGTRSATAAATPGAKGSRSLAEIQEWRLYIIQEFADGGTLRRALDQGLFHDHYTEMPRMDMLLDIAQGVASALAHLHSKNVVHGDLNPKNVLLKHAPLNPSSRQGTSLGRNRAGWASATVHPGMPHHFHPAGGPPAGLGGGGGLEGSEYGNYPLAGRCGFAVKVADFGLSVKMEHSHISGLRQGTPFYAAPELANGILSRASDTYAFGVLLWELYWGRPIWVPDARAPGGYVQHEAFPLLPHTCPPDVVALVADCLQPNHLQRPGFEELLLRLRNMAILAAAAALTGSCLDGTFAISMPGLPALLHSSAAAKPPPGTLPSHQPRQLHAAMARQVAASAGVALGDPLQQRAKSHHVPPGAPTATVPAVAATAVVATAAEGGSKVVPQWAATQAQQPGRPGDQMRRGNDVVAAAVAAAGAGAGADNEQLRAGGSPRGRPDGVTPILAAAMATPAAVPGHNRPREAAALRAEPNNSTAPHQTCSPSAPPPPPAGATAAATAAAAAAAVAPAAGLCGRARQVDAPPPPSSTPRQAGDQGVLSIPSAAAAAAAAAAASATYKVASGGKASCISPTLAPAALPSGVAESAESGADSGAGAERAVPAAAASCSAAAAASPGAHNGGAGAGGDSGGDSGEAASTAFAPALHHCGECFGDVTAVPAFGGDGAPCGGCDGEDLTACAAERSHGAFRQAQAAAPPGMVGAWVRAALEGATGCAAAAAAAPVASAPVGQLVSFPPASNPGPAGLEAILEEAEVDDGRRS